MPEQGYHHQKRMECRRFGDHPKDCRRFGYSHGLLKNLDGFTAFAEATRVYSPFVVAFNGSDWIWGNTISIIGMRPSKEMTTMIVADGGFFEYNTCTS